MILVLAATAALAVALLSAPVVAEATADGTWKTHQDQNCGIEFKYPPSYVLEGSGARDSCELWITIGVREARRLRGLINLEIREMESSAGPPRSARDFALHVATAQCAADGADGSTYCLNGEARSPFKTTQGFRGFEILLLEVHLDYASTAETPLKLGARFEAGRLLAYANPTSAETRLKAGVTRFPLVIFYGARIKPVTFDALLNGDNISGRFTPEPEGYQIVRLPLAPGVNTLVLSVEGITAGDQTVTDTHRLIFRVE